MVKYRKKNVIWLGFENISKIARKKMIKIIKNDAVSTYSPAASSRKHIFAVLVKNIVTLLLAIEYTCQPLPFLFKKKLFFFWNFVVIE